MTIRNIFILSRIEAEKFNPATVAVPPCTLISITEPHEVLPNFVYGKEYFSTHRFSFHDVTANTAWESGGRYKAMTLDQACDLAKNIRDVELEISTLVIHCAAGLSRSSAVALAIAEHLKLSHVVQEIHNSMHYFPNGHVLKLMRLAFGTHRDGYRRADIEAMYFKLFAGHLYPWSLEAK